MISIPNAGELNKRASIYLLTQTPSNEMAIDWSDESEFNEELFLQCFCKLENVGALAYYDTASRGQGLSHRAWVRKKKGYTDEITLTNSQVRIVIENAEFCVLRALDLDNKFTMLELQYLRLRPNLLGEPLNV